MKALNPSFNKYLSNTLWPLFEQGIRLISGLFIGIFVARVLDPEEYGIFSYVLSIYFFLFTFTRFGLDDIVIKKLLENPKDEIDILSSSFYIKLILSFIPLLLFFIYLFFTDGLYKWHFFIISIAPFFRSFEVPEFYFRAHVKTKYPSQARILQLIINGFVKIYLILNNASVGWFITTILLEEVLNAIFYVYIFWKESHQFFIKKFNYTLIKQLSIQSYPLFLSSFALLAQTRLDHILIKLILGNHALGIYSSSYKIIEISFYLPLIVTNSLFPALLNAKGRNQKLYFSRFQKLYLLMLALMLPLSFTLSFLSKNLITVLFTDTYLEASLLFKYHIFSLFIYSYYCVSSRYYLVEGLYKLELYKNLFAVFVSISLNLILLPTLSLMGAVYSSLVSLFFATFLFDLFFKETRINLKLKFPFLKL